MERVNTLEKSHTRFNHTEWHEIPPKIKLYYTCGSVKVHSRCSAL